MSQAVELKVAILGVPQTGRSTLAAKLNFYEWNSCLNDHSFRLLVTDVDESTSSLLTDFHFLLITFDASVPYSKENGGHSALKMLRNAVTAKSDLTRVFFVGTKWDLIPQDPLAIALSLEGCARMLAIDAPSLKTIPVSAITGAGCSELVAHIARAIEPRGESTSITAALRGCVKNLGSWLLDKTAELLSLPVPECVNQPTPDPQDLDDSAIDELIKSPETRAWDAALVSHAGFIDRSTCHKITPTLVAKKLSATEYATMLYLRSHTRIPVPQPRYPQLRKWLVMDLIEGRMLLDCWESQSFWMKLRIACTLRGYIRQLRRLKSNRPGSVIDGLIEHNLLFDERTCGPFTSAKQFQLWAEYVAHGGWVRYMQHRRNYELPGPDPPYPVMGGNQWSLVFTHGDLNLSNIMLSKDGVLCIIDWATGGFFPPWLETIGIKYSKPLPSFARFIWFISGSYPRYEAFWSSLMNDVHRGYPMPAIE